MKKWLKNTRRVIEEKCKKELTEEKLKQLKEDNPDGGEAIKTLTEEQQNKVNTSIAIRAGTEMDVAIKNASMKLRFLRNIETTVAEEDFSQNVQRGEDLSRLWANSSEMNYIKPNDSLVKR